MIRLIEKLADRALSLFVPKTDAWAYRAGCTNRCIIDLGCSDWECCLVGTSSTFWQRTCPRSSSPSDGCYLQFSGHC